MTGIHAFQCSYKPLLVILSFAISVFGAYCSLQLASQIPRAAGKALAGWLSGAAIALGGGAIWSMHFIAMIACQLPIPVTYDPLITLTSLTVAIVMTGIGLYVAGRGQRRIPRLLAGGAFAGLGVAAMHYIGMAAMEIGARTTYKPPLIVASVVIAVVAATAALWLAFNVHFQWQKLTAALVMGVAVCGMHYTAMAAAVFVPDPRITPMLSRGALRPDELAYFVFGFTLLVLLLLSTGSGVIESRRSREILLQAHADLERQVAERTLSLAASEGLMRSIIESMLEGLITVDSASVIRSVNAAAERIFLYSRDELVGQPLTILLPESLRGDPTTFFAESQRRANDQITEWEARRKNGSIFPMELSLFALSGPKGRMFGGSVRDISERHEVDRLKKEFISTVSHELRTPLTSIRGSLGLINGGVVGEIPPEAKVLLDIAYKNTERLSRLVNDILDLEKIESGRTEFRPESIEAGDLIDAALDLNRGYAEQYGVRLEPRRATLPAWVFVDRDRLLQVLTNLLSNAVKFSPKDTAVEVTLFRREGGLRISVADRGPGIPEEFRSRIFQRFQQADSSDTRQKGGTGLGLAISKSIVEKFHGQLSFESEVGKGTSFHIDLPESPTPAALVEAEAASPADSKPGRRILICEDDLNQANILSVLLQSAGYQTEIARDAAEAKALLAQRSFDAMTLDIVMPGQDEISLIRELRSEERTRLLPILVIALDATAKSEGLAGDAFGFIDWLEKPVDAPRLLAAIQLSGRASSRPPRILHVEDDRDVVTLLKTLLGGRAEVVAVGSCREAEKALRDGGFDLLVLDIELPDGSGVDLLPLLSRPGGPRVPVIVFSAHELSREMARAIEAVLVKSRTSNEQILETIESFLNLPEREAS